MFQLITDTTGNIRRASARSYQLLNPFIPLFSQGFNKINILIKVKAVLNISDFASETTFGRMMAGSIHTSTLYLKMCKEFVIVWKNSYIYLSNNLP